MASRSHHSCGTGPSIESSGDVVVTCGPTATGAMRTRLFRPFGRAVCAVSQTACPNRPAPDAARHTPRTRRIARRGIEGTPDARPGSGTT